MCRAERISSRLSPILDDRCSRMRQLAKCWEGSFASVASNGLLKSIRLSYCQIICTPSGRFLAETLCILSDGLGSNVNSPNAGWRLEDRNPRSVRDANETVDAAFGSPSSGNTRLRRKATWNVMWIISITIRSNTVTPNVPSTGRGPASIDGSNTVPIRATGAARTFRHNSSSTTSRRALASDRTPNAAGQTGPTELRHRRLRLPTQFVNT